MNISTKLPNKGNALLNSLVTKAAEYIADTSGPKNKGATVAAALAILSKIFLSALSASKKSYLFIADSSTVIVSKEDTKVFPFGLLLFNFSV